MDIDPITLTIFFVAALMFVYTRGRIDGRNATITEAKARSEAAMKDAVEKTAAAITSAAAAAVQLSPWPEPDPAFVAPVAIGERFRYLRVNMICTAHVTASPFGGYMPAVRADFQANDGSIGTRVFSGPELVALQAELDRGTP